MTTKATFKEKPFTINQFGEQINVGAVVCWENNYDRILLIKKVITIYSFAGKIEPPENDIVEYMTFTKHMSFVEMGNIKHFRPLPDNHFLNTIPEDWLTELLLGKSFYKMNELNMFNPVK